MSTSNTKDNLSSSSVTENKEAEKSEALYRNISIWEVYNNIFSKTVLVLDIRPKEEFEKGHILNAINFPVPKHITTNELKSNFASVQEQLNLKSFQQMVLSKLTSAITTNQKVMIQSLVIYCYGDKQEQYESRYSLIYHLSLMYKFSPQNFVVVSGGYDEFSQHLPFLCENNHKNTNHDNKKGESQTQDDKKKKDTSDEFVDEFMEDRSIYPNCIIDGRLFLGNSSHAMNKKVIVEQLKITHVLNITSSIPNYFEKYGVKYLQVRVEDDSGEDLISRFDEVIGFIENGLKTTSNKVFVHCELGVSRSSTIVIAYLMHAHRWDLYDAFLHCHRRRNVIRPNDGFLDQLGQFEKKLFAHEDDNTSKSNVQKVQAIIKDLFLQKMMNQM